MNLSLERKMLAGVGVALVFLSINAYVSYRATRKLIEHERLVTHTHKVLAILESTMSTMKDAETGQRGYMITGQREYLTPYESALEDIDQEIEELRQLTVDSPAQQARVPALKKKVEDRLASLKKGVEFRDNNPDLSKLPTITGVGKRQMDDLREFVDSMEVHENALLAQRAADAKESGREAILTLFIANLSAAALLLLISFVVGRDFTARKKAEDALRQQREWLRVTLLSIGDAVIATDTKGVVSFMNPVAQALTGWTEKEAEGRSLEAIFNIVNEETGKPVENPAVRAMREGAVVGLANHTMLIPRGGGAIPIDDSGAPIRDSTGRTLGSVLIFRDITDRRRAESERAGLLLRERAAREHAEAASRAKDEFVAAISHEVRSPLNAILGWAQMLNLGTLNQTETARAIKTIQRNARAQAQLIEDLMDISRVISGKLTLDVRPVDLGQIIEAAIESIGPAADAKSIGIDVNIDPVGGIISGDPSRLQQIVWNLLSNAVKFTPKGGTIEVRVEKVNSHAQVSVKDSGEGIRPEFLPYVFDRFSQADGSSQRKHGGLGLGLAIVRHLVELHGGSVRADSPGEGQGATFTIAFPIRAVREASAEGPRVSSVVGLLPDSITLQELKIMVVDDEEETRDLLTALLSQRGAEVRACRSTKEALDALDQWRPAVIVSDIGMPEEDGYTLIRKLRARPSERGGNIPAVALTAYARSEDRTRALSLGFQMHVPKPVEALELIMVIASLAGRSVRGTSG
jgi:PAS domain S-box-containing protein